MIDAIASKARAVGLSEDAVFAIVARQDMEAALHTATQVFALCRVAKRPELVNEYLFDVQACRERVINDRARADELLHIDTTPPVKNLWTQRSTS